MAPREITPVRLDTWLAVYENKGRSQQTIRMYAAYVKTFVGWLYKSGHLASNALESYDLPEEKPMGRKNWLRKTEVAKVIGAVKPKSSQNAKPSTIEKARQVARDLKFIPLLRVPCGPSPKGNRDGEGLLVRFGSWANPRAEHAGGRQCSEG
jgi:integrase